MKLIAVSGLKGGVGASSVAANLTCGFNQLDRKVAIVDLDLRNFIRVYFSMIMTEEDGWAVRVNQGDDWALAFYQSPAGVYFLPFGERGQFAPGREGSNRYIGSFSDTSSVYKLSDNFFSEMLASLASQFDYVILHLPVVTFSSDHMKLLQSLHAVIDLHLVVINPDTACYSILNTQGEKVSQFPKLKLLSNKYFSNSEVSSDFSFYMKKVWGELLVSNPIHFDEALAEATASLQTVGCYSPASLAATEFKTLALWTIATLTRNEGDYV